MFVFLGYSSLTAELTYINMHISKISNRRITSIMSDTHYTLNYLYENNYLCGYLYIYTLIKDLDGVKQSNVVYIRTNAVKLNT